MTRIVLALLVALTVRPALADHEGPDAHSHGAMRTITLDANDVRPGATTMDHGDVISFVNLSSHPIEVTFTEPTDLAKHIRCGLVRGQEKDAPAAPWALFTWQNDKLVATVPPGRFASVCSLEPGSYAFTAEAVRHAPQAAGNAGLVPSKGRIEVK